MQSLALALPLLALLTFLNADLQFGNQGVRTIYNRTWNVISRRQSPCMRPLAACLLCTSSVHQIDAVINDRLQQQQLSATATTGTVCTVGRRPLFSSQVDRCAG